MDQNYVLAELRSRGFSARPVTREAQETMPPPRSGGLSGTVIAPWAYGALERSLLGEGTSQPATWDEMPSAEREALVITVEEALTHYERVAVLTFPEMAMLFYNTFVSHAGEEGLPPWESLGREYQLAWEALARHFCYLGELEDVPFDINEQTAAWNGWVAKHLLQPN